MSILDTQIEFLKGVGPRRGSLLKKELSIYSFYDLLTFFPYRYVDRTKFYKINQITSFDIDVQLVGVVKRKKEMGVGRKKRLVVDFFDETGSVQIIFFKGIKWLNNFIQIEKKYLIFGKPQQYSNNISFIHPEMELLVDSTKRMSFPLYPVYHSTEKLSNVGLNSKGISKLVFQLLSILKNVIPETIPETVIRKYELLNRSISFPELHFPSNPNQLDKAIQSRIDSDAETKAQLIDIIKKGISNDSGKDQFSDVVTSDVPEDLSMQNAPSGQSNMVLYIVGSVILLLLLTLLFIVLRNQKKTPVYLKPKSVSDNQSASSNPAPVVPHTPIETSANMNSDVKRSELNSLRQSAVSMSVGQKDGATQIVKDWLSTESGSENSDGSEEEK